MVSNEELNKYSIVIQRLYALVSINKKEIERLEKKLEKYEPKTNKNEFVVKIERGKFLIEL